MKDKQIKYGMVLSYVYVAINICSGILLTPYLIKRLGQSQYGLYEIIVAVASDLSILSLGMGDSAVKYIATFRTEGNLHKQGEILGIVIKVLCILSVVAAAICTVYYWKFDTIYAKSLTSGEMMLGKRMFILAAFNLIVSLPGGAFSCILTAYEKFAVFRIVSISRVLLRILFVIIMMIFSPMAMTILVIDICLNLLCILAYAVMSLSWLKVPIILRTDDKSFYKKVLGFSGYAIFFSVAREVQFQTDKTIIGIRMSTAMVTIYAAGSKLSATFNQLGQTLSAMYLPKAIQITESKDPEKGYLDYMLSVGRLVLPIIMVVYIGFLFMGRAFLELWMGKGYEDAYISCAIMMTSLILPILEDTGVSILKARNRQRCIATTYLVSSLLNVALTWMTIPYLGIIGASLMTLITSGFLNVTMLNMILKKEIHFSIIRFCKMLLNGILPALLMSVLYFELLFFAGFRMTNWCSFVLIGSGFVIVYFAAIYIGYLDKNKKTWIRSKIKRLRNIID